MPQLEVYYRLKISGILDDCIVRGYDVIVVTGISFPFWLDIVCLLALKP